MMGGAVRRMLHRQLSMAWEKWQYEAAEMKRQQEMLDRALRRLRNAKMFAAWNMWRSWAEEMRRQQYLMAGAVRRMILRKLSQACEQWQWVAAVLKEHLPWERHSLTAFARPGQGSADTPAPKRRALLVCASHPVGPVPTPYRAEQHLLILPSS